ncbi:hypothetical protein LIER_30875 [Lithospermum erythrorhizon]|uniref:Helitron helicase-like domain-containing protein n=1 Tax=Lithospermum erythrorhizon TaxID=34254 RepID=A0AAV3RSH7_LITER
MALVQEYGRLDIFLTMTCNPNWPEITEVVDEFTLSKRKVGISTRSSMDNIWFFTSWHVPCSVATSSSLAEFSDSAF